MSDEKKANYVTVIGETFPLRTRAKQASLATAFNWLGKLSRSHNTLQLLTML
jgi:hypothetical protein